MEPLSPTRPDPLRQRWVKLLDRFEVTATDSGRVFDLLAAAYSAAGRHYHNLEHLAEMFRVADRLAPDTADPAAIELAIWFHDAVYDPRARDNEARSADLAVELLGPLGVPTPVTDKVAGLVRATAHLSSDKLSGDRDTVALLDADLAILGAAQKRYRRYAADIRREYAFVLDDEYPKGRAAVLKQFLARPRIFHHPLTFEECEARARVNLAAELKELSG